MFSVTFGPLSVTRLRSLFVHLVIHTLATLCALINETSVNRTVLKFIRLVSTCKGDLGALAGTKAFAFQGSLSIPFSVARDAGNAILTDA